MSEKRIHPRGRRGRFRLAAAGVGLALGLAAPAGAQTVNSGVSIGPSQELSTPLVPGTPTPTASSQVDQLLAGMPMFDGPRTSLGNLGIDILGDFITEFASNVSGGLKQGSTFANQLGLELDVDWQKLARIQGLSTHVVLVNRSGSPDSALIGENLQPVQEIYGAGGDVAIHLVYAYAEEKLLADRVNLAFGRMPVSNDFAASPLYCNFMNNSLCGNPKSLPGGDIGFSSYPDAVWGGRIRVRPTADTYIQTGIYGTDQDLYSYDHLRSGFHFDTSRYSGETFPVEAAWLPTFGADSLPGHYKVGFSYDNSSYNDFRVGDNGAPALLTGQPYKLHKGHTQFWALFDQLVLRQGPGPNDGLTLLGGYVHNDPTTSVYRDQFFGGLLERAFWKARPLDTIGVLFSYVDTSRQLASQQALDIQLGLPIANGATGVQHHSEIIEANYDIHVYRGVNFEPDFQYVFRPNGVSNIKSAAVLGFKSHIAF